MHADTTELLAIGMEIKNAQFVTLLIFDTRFTAVDARFVALNARIDAFEARIQAFDAKIDLILHRSAVKIITAVLLGQIALGPIGMQVFSPLRQVLSTQVH